jgi:cytochrome bd-type quinol oxidase subunit 1
MEMVTNAESQVKAMVEKQLHIFKNYAPKMSMLFMTIAFVGYFAYRLFIQEVSRLDMMEIFVESLRVAVVFAILGFWVGSSLSSRLAQVQLKKLAEDRTKRKDFINSQLKAREEKLRGLG